MRDTRRYIRPVGHPDEDSAEVRLTKHWYERPLSKKVKALGTLAGAIMAIGSVFAGAGRFIRHQADEALIQIIRRELVPVVRDQQTEGRIASEQRAEIKASVDLLRSDMRELRADLEKQRRKTKKRSDAEP